MDTTEITLAGGQRHEVLGSLEEVEAKILAASRGSIMQFAWLTEIATGRSVGINPGSIVSLRGGVTADPPRDVAS